jgi:dihydroorotate dehydrogenase electron transfer subunit
MGAGMIARRDHRVRVIARRDLSPTCFALELLTAEPLEAVPGQFGMLTCGEGLDPLLRRAFSLAAVRRHGAGSIVEMLLKEVGRGSGALRRLAEGAALQLIAPLGNGFTLAAPSTPPVALVAGGIGLPPVLFAAERMAVVGAPFDLYVGATTAAELLLVERCRAAAGDRLVLATDDGSAGEHGTVVAALERRLDAGTSYARVLACGPDPMLRAAARLARRRGLDAELSLEEPMACGVGVCLGCVVELADGRYVPSCKEGPVFRAADLAARWSE